MWQAIRVQVSPDPVVNFERAYLKGIISLLTGPYADGLFDG